MTTTVVHRDRSGRVTRLVTTREPEWDQEQQALLLALGEYRASTCDGCGGWLPDTTAPGAEDQWTAERAPTCQACKAINIVAGAGSKDDKHAHLYRWRLKRRG